MPSYRAKPAAKNGAKPKPPMHKMPDGHMMEGKSMAPSGAVHSLTNPPVPQKPRKMAKKGR